MNKEDYQIVKLFIAFFGIGALAIIALLPIALLHAQIGQAPVGGHPIGSPAASPPPNVPTQGPITSKNSLSRGQSPERSQDQSVETFQGYTALPQALLAGRKTADQMSPDERLRSAVEFCEMDFKPDVVDKSAEGTYVNPDCDKVMKVWKASGAAARYEHEIAAWRASQLDREKQLISRVAGEVK